MCVRKCTHEREGRAPKPACTSELPLHFQEITNIEHSLIAAGALLQYAGRNCKYFRRPSGQLHMNLDTFRGYPGTSK
eukprot:1140850-Pelagomonas_calceolata.AAC.4